MEYRNFDLNTLCSHPAVGVIGKRGSGKSWVVSNLIRQLNRSTLVVSPIEHLTQYYATHHPEVTVVRSLDAPELVDYFRDRPTEPRLLVLDDAISSKGVEKNLLLQRALLDGRYYHTSVVVTMQYPLSLPPNLRANFDYTFLLYEDFQSNRSRLYEHYAGMYNSLEQFNEEFDRLTDDHGAMVVVNRGMLSKLTDKVFWFKAQNPQLLLEEHLHQVNNQSSATESVVDVAEQPNLNEVATTGQPKEAEEAVEEPTEENPTPAPSVWERMLNWW